MTAVAVKAAREYARRMEARTHDGACSCIDQCAECEAASIAWANNGGDWAYRHAMKVELHKRAHLS